MSNIPSKNETLVCDGLWAEVEYQIQEIDWFASRKIDLAKTAPRGKEWSVLLADDLRELREAINVARLADRKPSAPHDALRTDDDPLKPPVEGPSQVETTTGDLDLVPHLRKLQSQAERGVSYGFPQTIWKECADEIERLCGTVRGLYRPLSSSEETSKYPTCNCDAKVRGKGPHLDNCSYWQSEKASGQLCDCGEFCKASLELSFNPKCRRLAKGLPVNGS